MYVLWKVECVHTQSQKKEGFQTEKYIKIIPLDTEFGDDCFFIPMSIGLQWKAGLKLNIQKTKIMASSPITSWQIDGETMERVTDFIFLGSKITADEVKLKAMKLKDICLL